MKEIKNINEFNAFINEENSTVIFYTKWCPVCRMLIFSFEEYCEDHPDINVGKVCISELKDLTELLKIQSTPTILLFNKGNVIEKRHGMLEYDEIDEIFLSLTR